MSRRRRMNRVEKNFEDVDQVRESPRPDWPAAPFIGAALGAIAGLAASEFYLYFGEISLLGMRVYPGDGYLVNVIGLVGGLCLGAFAGWLNMEP